MKINSLQEEQGPPRPKAELRSPGPGTDTELVCKLFSTEYGWAWASKNIQFCKKLELHMLDVTIVPSKCTWKWLEMNHDGQYWIFQDFATRRMTHVEAGPKLFFVSYRKLPKHRKETGLHGAAPGWSKLIQWQIIYYNRDSSLSRWRFSRPEWLKRSTTRNNQVQSAEAQLSTGLEYTDAGSYQNLKSKMEHVKRTWWSPHILALMHCELRSSLACYDYYQTLQFNVCTFAQQNKNFSDLKLYAQVEFGSAESRCTWKLFNFNFQITFLSFWHKWINFQILSNAWGTWLAAPCTVATWGASSILALHPNRMNKLVTQSFWTLN
jgi:hypothetical protein